MLTALTQPSPEALRAEIRRCREMTSAPFGVNVTILPALIPADYDEYMRVVAEEKVAVCEISGGSPKKYVDLLHSYGVKIIHKSATMVHARKAQAAGVDFIEVAGFESSIAGRSSEDDVGAWVLLAKALSELSTPVLVSGASATGRQVAAALAMGAVGVTMGTRFVATKEAPVHPLVKEKLASKDTDEFSTTLVLRSLNNATRVYKSEAAKKVLEIENKGLASGEPVDFSELRDYVAGEKNKQVLKEHGQVETSTWSCGQSVGLIYDIPTVKELVDRIVAEAEERLHAVRSVCVAQPAKL
jgi:nitronate monooxygenase